MPLTQNGVREFLLLKYEERRKKNSRYSLRAYSKLLGISSGRLSDILNKKSNLGYSTAVEIAVKLDLTVAEKARFLALVTNELHASSRGRSKVKSRFRQLSADEFSLISDWEYFALMALIDTKSFKSDVSWIANKMDLSESRVRVVLDDLKAKGLLSVSSSGDLSTIHSEISTVTDIPSEVLKEANVKAILRGIEKIESTDISLRDVTSLTLPVSLEKIREVKALIRQCKNEIMKVMDGAPTTEVYNLNIQFVPVSNPEVK